MKKKRKPAWKVPVKKRQRVEDFAMRSACGNGVVANKGFRKPVNRFTQRVVTDPNANKSLSQLLGIPGCQDQP